MIVWITGAPCIGKTTFICRFLAPRWRYLAIDLLRDRMLETHPSILNKICPDIGVPNTQWPPNSLFLRTLYSSPDRYLNIQTSIGYELCNKYNKLLNRIRNNGNWLIEVSPFLLANWSPNEPIIMLYVPPSVHTERIEKKIKCGHEKATALVDFYWSTLDLISPKLRVTKIYRIENQSVPDLIEFLQGVYQ